MEDSPDPLKQLGHLAEYKPVPQNAQVSNGRLRGRGTRCLLGRFRRHRVGQVGRGARRTSNGEGEEKVRSIVETGGSQGDGNMVSEAEGGNWRCVSAAARPTAARTSLAVPVGRVLALLRIVRRRADVRQVAAKGELGQVGAE